MKQKLADILPNQQKFAPSIPNKFQGYGYEHGADGQLELQDPVNPGYSGRFNDAVGPLDYNPDTSIKYRSVPHSNFSKVTCGTVSLSLFVTLFVTSLVAQGSQRDSLDRIRAKNSDVPGPGYYNSRSVFDLPEAGGGTSYNDTDFLMQLNAARKRQSAVFESRTQRDSMLRGISKRRNEPGTPAFMVDSRLVLIVYFCRTRSIRLASRHPNAVQARRQAVLRQQRGPLPGCESII